MGAWCTSIIAKQADGTIIHSRNLDYDAAPQMRTITFRSNYMRDGKLLFEAVQFAGNIGIYTGMRPDAFSISQNTRQHTAEDSPAMILVNVVMLFGGIQENSWIIRDALTNCADYQCAYEKLAHQPQPSFGYNILAGTKDDEGVVIARNRFGPAHESHLNAANGTWFLVQTNNDHWDSGCYNRCLAATERIEKVGQADISHKALRDDVMFLFPTENRDTLYNTDFTPKTALMNTVITDYEGDEPGPYQYDKPKTFKEKMDEVRAYI